MDGASSKQMFFYSFNSFYLMRLYNFTFLKDIFLFTFLFLCCFHLCSIFVLSRLDLRRTVIKTNQTMPYFLCKGNVWVYSIRTSVSYEPGSSQYCDQTCYLFSFWIITATYIFLTFLCCCCCCILLIAGCGISIAGAVSK
jgi:hypothetical protein